jgi:predicted nucleic acid-binding protein
MVIHADSTFIIDLLREQRRGKPGKAAAFLEGHADDQLAVPVFVVCELEAGAANAVQPDREQARLRTLLHAVSVVYPDERFAPAYGDLLVRIRRAGRTVATMDLLIATAAVIDSAAVVTANPRHFRVVPGLTVLEY